MTTQRVTNLTFWDDSLGKRMAINFSEVDETGNIVTDGICINKLITEKEQLDNINALTQYAQDFVNSKYGNPGNELSEPDKEVEEKEETGEDTGDNEETESKE